MLKPIRNNGEYNSALDTAFTLMQKDLKEGSKDSDYLEALSILIEAYEKAHFPIGYPNPIDAILFRLEQLNMSTSDLKKYLGHRSRVSDILSGNRKLSLKMIRILNEKLNIPAEVLIKEYQPRRISRDSLQKRSVRNKNIS